ncbi:MAG: SEC-C metal-binding domain-containing protein, partial [Alphaproteobacteria bacterium]
RNFEARKNILKYDNVMNDQRKVIFGQRIEMMKSEDLSDVITDMRHEVIRDMVREHIPEKAYPEQWDTEGLHEEVKRTFGFELPVKEWAAEEGIADEEVCDRLIKAADRHMAEKSARFSPDIMRQVEKSILLRTIDRDWYEHLQQLDHLRGSIFLRGYAQRDPLNEYKSEAFALFEHLLTRLRQEVTHQLMVVDIVTEPPELDMPRRQMHAHHFDPLLGEDDADFDEPAPRQQPVRRTRQPGAAVDPNDPGTWGKVPRNAACPCGSGKKFKHCHGRVGATV